MSTQRAVPPPEMTGSGSPAVWQAAGTLCVLSGRPATFRESVQSRVQPIYSGGILDMWVEVGDIGPVAVVTAVSVRSRPAYSEIRIVTAI